MTLDAFLLFLQPTFIISLCLIGREARLFNQGEIARRTVAESNHADDLMICGLPVVRQGRGFVMIEAKDLDSLAWKAGKVKQLPDSFEFSVQAELCTHTSRTEFFS